jgi:hypothetical protein
LRSALTPVKVPISTSGLLATLAAENVFTSYCGYCSRIMVARRTPIACVATDCAPVMPSISGSMTTAYLACAGMPSAGSLAFLNRAVAALRTALS